MSPARLVFALTAALLLALSGPSVALRDGGELTTAAATLDVAHPTGFAVDLVLARALLCVPVGDMGHRANLASALWGALAFALLAALAHRLLAALVAPRAAFVLAAGLPLALLASPTLLHGLTAFEVYASSLAVSLLAAHVTLAAPAPARALPVLAALGGLTVGMHTNARLSCFLCALVTLVSLARSEPRALPRAFAQLLAFGALGACVALYLPVASRANRWLDWGDPETLASLWRHLTAARIREAFAHRMLVPWRVPEDSLLALRVVREDLSLPLLLLVAPGALLSLRRQGFRLLALLGFTDAVYAVLLNPMALGDRQVLFVAECCFAVLALLPVALALRLLAARAQSLAAVAVLLLAVLGLALRFDPLHAARSDGWTSTELLGGGNGVVGTAPPRAVILCEGDDLCGGSLYAQRVEGERPDVTVLPRQHLQHDTTWRRAASRALAPVALEPARSLRQRRLRALLAALGPDVRWESGDGADERALRLRLYPGETPVLATLEPVSTEPFTSQTVFAWLGDRVASGYVARRTGASVLVTAGQRVAQSQGPEGAAPLWRAALAWNPESAGALGNLAVVEATAGRIPEALALVRRALEADPDRATAWRNLALYLRAQGDEQGALRAESQARARGLLTAPR